MMLRRRRAFRLEDEDSVSTSAFYYPMTTPPCHCSTYHWPQLGWPQPWMCEHWDTNSISDFEVKRSDSQKDKRQSKAAFHATTKSLQKPTLYALSFTMNQSDCVYMTFAALVRALQSVTRIEEVGEYHHFIARVVDGNVHVKLVFNKDTEQKFQDDAVEIAQHLWYWCIKNCPGLRDLA